MFSINKILLLACVLSVVATSCKKEAFDYKLYQPTVDDIDSIYFSTGATSLIADGKASLQFVVETYRTIQITNAQGGKKDSLVNVDYKNLPSGSLKIFKAGGAETGMAFSTSDASSNSVSFYAQVGNLKSETNTVSLRAKQVLPQKRFIDVVFHVFELSATDPKYDKLTYQPITQNLLEAAIIDVNKVFNNQLGNDPNGGIANIEFRLAAKRPAGTLLDKPGYNMITYDKSWMASTFFSPNDFINKINSTASYTWDPQKYLNIYIIPSGANNSMGDSKPKYQIVPSGGEIIPGITSIISTASEMPTNKNYETYGVGVPRTLFFPGSEMRIELSPYLGTYYGLVRTAVSSPTTTDYCTDTRKYIGTNQFQNLVKVGIDGIKFLANNAMDDNRYPSLRNSFTLDQVSRMRKVMDQCPNRLHAHP